MTGAEAARTEDRGPAVLAQLPVVCRFSLGIQQADLRRGNLVQQFLGKAGVSPGLIGANVGHALIGGIGDHVRVGLEDLNG